jgi:hypothetical protein
MGKIGLKYIIFRDLIDRLRETVMYPDLPSPLPIGHKKLHEETNIVLRYLIL